MGLGKSLALAALVGGTGYLAWKKYESFVEQRVFVGHPHPNPLLEICRGLADEIQAASNPKNHAQQALKRDEHQ